MSTLLDNSFGSITLDEARGILVLKRKGLRFPSNEVLQAWFSNALQIIEVLDRSRLVLLNDIREAPLRSDPAFDQLVAPFLARLLQGFKKSAVLVRSAVGELQQGRRSRETGQRLNVFRDEQEAIAYLLEPEPG